MKFQCQAIGLTHVFLVVCVSFMSSAHWQFSGIQLNRFMPCCTVGVVQQTVQSGIYCIKAAKCLLLMMVRRATLKQPMPKMWDKTDGEEDIDVYCIKWELKVCTVCMFLTYIE